MRRDHRGLPDAHPGRVSLIGWAGTLTHPFDANSGRWQQGRLSFSVFDRLVFVDLYRLFPKICDALAIVKPDTIVRWHRADFRLYWCWKSRRRGGRPTVPLEIRKLIREMSIANSLWGAPRIHGELLKLGIEIGQTSVAKYMATRRGPPSQGWKTFLNNHADGIAAMDLFVVPTISFRLLYGLLIVGHGRRQILWLGVISQPTAIAAYELAMSMLSRSIAKRKAGWLASEAENACLQNADLNLWAGMAPSVIA